MLKNVELFVIDLDGTLVDTRRDISFAVNSTLSQFQIAEIPEDRIAEYVGTGIMPLFEERVPRHLLPPVVERFEETYLNHIADSTRLFAGWEKVLPLVEDKILIILTNKIQKFTDALLSKLQLDSKFAGIYGREAFSERKPSGVPVQMILEKHGVSADKALMIGDMPVDILSGKNAGVQTCAALFGYGRRESLIELKPTCTIKSPADLIGLLGLVRKTK